MLINDIETLKSFIPTIAGNDFSRYSHHLDLADEWLEKEILGHTLFAVLVAPEDNELFRKKCQAVVAHKSYLTAIPFLDLIETNNGFAVTSNDNLAPASKDRVAALVKAIDLALTERVDSLLEYLEETTAFHDAWKGSPTYSLLYDTFLFTIREFRRYAFFQGNRLDFINAKSTMLIAIAQKIEPIISQELSDEIIEQLRDNDLSDDNQKIIDSIRFAFANYTIGNDNLADNFIFRARKALLKNPDSFPAFKNSELYASILSTASFNGDDSPFLVLGS